MKTHIWNNGLKSVLLLLLFPFVVPLVCFVFLGGALATTGDLRAWPTAEHWFLVLSAASLAITGVWLPVGYLISQWLIDVATGARAVSRRDEPRVWNLLETLCISRGMAMPHLRIIEDPAMNAFASGLTRATSSVTVTRGLVDNLDDAELEGVLAHELTHIINRDTQLLVISAILVGIVPLVHDVVMRVFWMLVMGFLNFYRFIFTIIPMPGARAMAELGYGLMFLVGRALAAIVSSIGYFCSLLISFALSRRREFMADAGAVELTKNPDALISALNKITGNSDIATTISGVRQMFFDNPRIAGLEGLLSTHPSTEKRIAALAKYAGGRQEEMVSVALPRPPHKAAYEYGADLPHRREKRPEPAQRHEPEPAPLILGIEYRRLIADAIRNETRVLPVEVRTQLYARARMAVEQQLDRLEPLPSDTQRRSELSALERAIADVEASLLPSAGSRTRDQDRQYPGHPQNRRSVLRWAIVATVLTGGIAGAFLFAPREQILDLLDRWHIGRPVAAKSTVPLAPAAQSVAGLAVPAAPLPSSLTPTAPAPSAIVMPVPAPQPAAAPSDELPGLDYASPLPSTIRYGDLAVTAAMAPSSESDGDQPTAQGTVAGVPVFVMTGAAGFSDQPMASLMMMWLDPKMSLPQVVMRSYTGGAHCCTQTTIATQSGDGKWRVVDGGLGDGTSGYEFTDIDHDGRMELISSDDTFLYTFDCYACSYPPTRISQLRNGKLVDVSTDPAFRTFQLAKLTTIERQMQQQPPEHRNGYLAGMVAQAALVGQFGDAWSRAMREYDRATPADICAGDQPLEKCPASRRTQAAFPASLADHLIKHNYATNLQIAAAQAAIAEPASAVPSFDCTKAARPDEYAICGNAALAQLDQATTAAFNRFRAVDRQAALGIARAFLDERHACGPDAQCIEAAQRRALGIFNASLQVGALPPPPSDGATDAPISLLPPN